MKFVSLLSLFFGMVSAFSIFPVCQLFEGRFRKHRLIASLDRGISDLSDEKLPRIQSQNGSSSASFEFCYAFKYVQAYSYPYRPFSLFEIIHESFETQLNQSYVL